MAFDKIPMGMKPFNDVKPFNRESFAQNISKTRQNFHHQIKYTNNGESKNALEVLKENSSILRSSFVFTCPFGIIHDARFVKAV